MRAVKCDDVELEPNESGYWLILDNDRPRGEAVLIGDTYHVRDESQELGTAKSLDDAIKLVAE